MDLTYLKPPVEGTMKALSLTADTASAATALWTPAAGVLDAKKLLTFICTVDVEVIISDDGSTGVSEPDPTSASGGDISWPIAANTPTSFECGFNNRYIRAIAAENCLLKWRVE